jgi:magnesium-transporting ATPase (P-type)
MSVIVRTLGSDHFDLFAKGAPEKIAMLSKCLFCTKPTLFTKYHKNDRNGWM